MWPEPRPTSASSDILIHATVWPQYTNVIKQSDNGLIAYANHFWETVCKTVRSMLSCVSVSDCFVTLVYCGQTVAWIKMSLDAEVGLGSGHVYSVSWRPSFPYGKGHSSPLPLLRFTEESRGPCLLWPCNGWMDQDTTWYGGRPRPRRYCVRLVSSPQRGTAPSFRPMFVLAKWLDGSRCHLVRR